MIGILSSICIYKYSEMLNFLVLILLWQSPTKDTTAIPQMLSDDKVQMLENVSH